MKIEQIYTGCLAQGAYYIQSENEAVIIDPLREVDSYVEKAKENGATIKYIFETHFHADFVSGHVDLAKKTGAKIVFGPTATTAFDSHIGTDGEIFEIGKIKIKLLHTPGHTMESSTFLLIDEEGKEQAIFSGDTLFIGDVGRPDLAVKSDLTEEDLAGHLFDSLRNKIMTLPDDVVVYPAHGAGSACGKHMSSETWDTLANQKKTNYALRVDMTRVEFIKEVTEGIMPPPQYFAKNAMMNKSGYESIDKVMETGTVPLDVETFEAMANHEGALVLDTRHQNEFVKGHIPNSIFIGIDGSFAPWVGALITDLKQPIIFLADEGREEEVVTRLSRVGYDNTLGYLKGGFEAWAAADKEVDNLESITPQEFENRMNQGELDVLDVRKPGEFQAEHVDQSVTFPLDFINTHMAEVDANHKYYVYCAGGYRSVIASSILKSRGIHDLVNVEQGFKGISTTGIKTTDYVCPSTLK
ncbi:Glyoxylase, beta-lactamase superfamily II [Reichenbachiella faecimaris]|uniref:Glyoxylase, beta-lactamase superfamily II n=1 Tax=Reichenbachiella faecimaris TaxID=692418 RepID=A0A1W2GKG4_REIFA|nr:MBL fold metallo-hydrolase [Reichenbachiella faecimaris]SMD37140.1 Glyoxylase, beta-lactamase superfamily II [Reichenbachiella faecimaris]